MRKFGIGAALLTLLAGTFGFILRHLYMTRAIEPDTGLPALNSPALIALVIYTVFIIVLAFVLAYIARRFFDVKEKYREVIAPVNVFYICCMVAVYVLLLASGVIKTVLAVSAETTDHVLLIRAIMMVLTGLSLFGLAYETTNKKDYRGSLVFSIVPEIAITFWLLIYYRANQTNPVLLDYMFVALALAATAFGFYFTAGYVYGRRAPLRFIFSYSTAIYFLITALAGDLSLADKLAFIGLAVFFMINLSQFVGNLLQKNRRTADLGSAPENGDNVPQTSK
ncbi:MAG: hypothetical protein GX823_00245 [Clostridiales bacterium]|nr:hypothetical protein [Clostridiales bacterium]